MFSNPITGRTYAFKGYSSDENEYIDPDTSLAIAIVIFCVAGPFWLLFRFVKHVGKKSVLLTSQTLEKMKKSAGA
jgi:hypothetical protein